MDIVISSAEGDLLYNGGGETKRAASLRAEDIETLKSGTQQKRPTAYYVLSLTVDIAEYLSELTEHLTAVAECGDLVVPYSDCTVIYIKAVGKARDYRSAGEFAHTLYDNLSGETRLKFGIGVGGIAALIDEIPEIIEHGVNAYKFGRLMDPESNVYSYKEYALHKLLDSLPQATLVKHLKMLSEPEVPELFNDAEMTRTADIFLKKSLNLSETARHLYMHRNTLIYRLDRIEDVTGLNIRYFSDAVIFRMMMTLSKLIK